MVWKSQNEPCPSGQNPNWHSVSNEFHPVCGGVARSFLGVAGNQPLLHKGAKNASRCTSLISQLVEPTATGIVHAFFNRGKKGGFFSGELNGHLGLVVFHVINILQNKQAMSAIVPLLNPAQ